MLYHYIASPQKPNSGNIVGTNTFTTTLMFTKKFTTRLLLATALTFGVAEQASARPFWGTSSTGADSVCIDGTVYFEVQDYRFFIAWGDSYYQPTGMSC